MEKTHKFATAADASAFTLAGDAIITLTSLATGARYTYQVSAAKDRETGRRPEHPTLFFVSLLTGPNNDADYTYLGTLRVTLAGPLFALTAKSRMTEDATPVRAFRFFAQRVLVAGVLPPKLEVRHEGRCGRCARRLTVPESIDRGIGPECAGIIGRTHAPRSLGERLARRLAA